MALDIVRQYISLISEYFKLSDMAVTMLSPSLGGEYLQVVISTLLNNKIWLCIRTKTQHLYPSWY